MLFQVNRVLAVPDSGLTCASHAGNAFVLKPEDGLFVRVSAGENELIMSTLFYQLFYWLWRFVLLIAVAQSKRRIVRSTMVAVNDGLSARSKSCKVIEVMNDGWDGEAFDLFSFSCIEDSISLTEQMCMNHEWMFS